MPNPLHLQRLLAGGSTWNEWKDAQHREVPEFRADLSAADLCNQDLTGLDLSYVNLAGAKLQGAKVSETSFECAVLEYANFDGLDLRHASLRGANLRHASFRCADLQRIENHQVWEADFEYCDLSGANLSYADLGDEEIIDPPIGRERLSRADETRALITGRFAVPGYSHGPSFIEFNRGASLCHARLENANLIGARLRGVFARNANLRGANLGGSDLFDCSLEESDLREAVMHRANLCKANLSRANLGGADLSCALLSSADLSGANLERANLEEAVLVNTNMMGANLSGVAVYGLSSWNIKLEQAIQHDILITPAGEPAVRASDLELAQFLYLVLSREKVRTFIDAMTSRTVLLLGRFGGGGLEVLRSLGEQLRRLNYVPLIFDFERPRDRNYTETVKALAGLSRFVIVDLSGPSVPQELYATVPHLKIPFIPIHEKGRDIYAMCPDILEYEWVVKPPLEFETTEDLLRATESRIVRPAEARVQQREAALRDLYPSHGSPH